MTTVQKVLLVIGILGLLKGCWGLIHPSSFRKVSGVMLGVVRKIPNFYGAGMVAAGVAVWAVILVGLPLSYWVLSFFGLLFVWAGVSCIHKGGMDHIGKPLVVRQHLMVVRILSAVALVVSGLVVWVAMSDKF